MAEEYWWKEYAVETYGVKMAEPPYTHFGKKWPKLTAGLRVTGKMPFTTDIRPPDLLHARDLKCPYAHARLVSIDTSEAENMPGVIAVLTHKDSAPLGETMLYQSGRPYFAAPGDELCMYGQEIAAVIAENPHQADDALEKIKVEYEVLPHVLTIEEAMAPGAPEALTGRDNVRDPQVYNRGDVEAGFAEADVIVEETYYPQKLNTQGIEPRQAVCKYEGGPPPYGKFTAWARHQHLWGSRDGIALTFGLPQSNVRVICHAQGGSYGAEARFRGPTSCRTPYGTAALGAWITGRPVRASTLREGENTGGGHGHGWYEKHMKFGVKNDGTLTAMQDITYSDGGAFGSAGLTTYIFDLYSCSNVHTENHRIYTNHSDTGAYRGVNDPHTNAGVESHIDKCANVLGMDPVEFRKKNYVKADEGDQPPRDTPRVMSTHNIMEVTDQVKEAIGWEAKYHEPGTRTLPDGRLHGIGFAGDNDSHGTSGTVGDMFIKVYSDGSIQQLNGAIENGHGLWTYCSIIIAEELGIDPQKVGISGGDTDATAEHGGSWGSTRTVGTGWGATTAALDAKRQLAEAAIDRFWPDAAPVDLEFKDNMVTNTKTGESKDFTEVCSAANSYWGGPVIGHGYRPPDSSEYDDKYRRMNWAAHACEIAVDPETGEIEILNYVACHDVGPPVNLLTTNNVTISASTQGISGALFERHYYDPDTGVCLNDNYEDFKIATMLDNFNIKPMVANELVDGVPPLPVDRLNHHGVRGFAEPPKSCNSSVLANAFYNATGKRPTVWPLTPDKIIPLLKGEAVPIR